MHFWMKKTLVMKNFTLLKTFILQKIHINLKILRNIELNAYLIALMIEFIATLLINSLIKKIKNIIK